MNEIETTLNTMSIDDLRKYAKGNGISILGMNREAIIAAIIRAEQYTGSQDTTIFAGDCR